MSDNSNSNISDPVDFLSGLIEKALGNGADAADAIMFQSTSIAASQRLAVVEKIQRSESIDVGLRVFAGKRQAVVSTTQFSKETLDELAARAVAMAKTLPENPYCGLADKSELATKISPAQIAELELADPDEPDPQGLAERAAQMEEAALAVKGVTNSEGAEADWGRTKVALVASNGFAGTYSRTHFGAIISVLAGQNTAMEREYEYSASAFANDLMGPREMGTAAGLEAVKRLNSKKVETTKASVVYGPRMSGSVLGHLSGAINGAMIARGTSFLKERMGEIIFPQNITIIDDPRRKRGLRSRPFDGEGIAPQPQKIIEEGRLTTWILDLATARQLEMTSTGRGSRGTGGPPSPSATNLYMEAGKVSPRDLIGDIKQGLYVTELMGSSVNMITGDYSRGASGFWIENGEITYPVSEVTIAGNLNEMFMNLTAANDLAFRYGVDAPTLRVEGMTVAGQ